jgi:hypothetical protein
MIKANEIRIGNWLKGAYDFQVTEIPGYDQGCYDPIPLTEEWFTKFGFVNGRNHGGMVLLVDKDRGDYLDSNVRFVFFPGSYNIQYVHQLQNLYFALSGEELIIKN